MISPEALSDSGCDGCGRALSKAKKVHHGKRYCSTCYPRLFKRRMCGGCGNFARLPVFDLAARCRACRQKEPCARCGKTNFPVGLQSPYGPVCKACVPHFRLAKTCEACGAISQRIAKNSKTGRLTCSRCSAPPSGTCASCRRHRILINGEGGVLRCKACSTHEIRKCQGCDAEIPAGRGRECEACSRTRTFTNRLNINVNGFSSVEFEGLFRRFGEWLLSFSGPHNAALRINVHYKFFRKIEITWGKVPGYQDLLDHFSASGLRRAENPMRWLVQTGLVNTDEALREQSSEWRRVEKVLAEVNAPWPASLLSGYFEVLSARLEQGRTSVLSMRLALRAAASFLTSCDLAAGTFPVQKDLEVYWRASPGQVAALTGFVNYLNRHHTLQLNAQPDEKWLKRAKKAKSEKALVALLHETPKRPEFEARWICAASAYFHDRKLRRKELIYTFKKYEGVSGYEIEVGQNLLWIPAPDQHELVMTLNL
jgi:hypothetical protein